MSKFYQRYLQNLKVGEKKSGEASGLEAGRNTVDPTSMIGGPGVGAKGGKMNKVRRVQIMNKSDDFNPDASSETLVKYDKSTESENFLRDTLHSHYLFAQLIDFFEQFLYFFVLVYPLFYFIFHIYWYIHCFGFSSYFACQ